MKIANPLNNLLIQLQKVPESMAIKTNVNDVGAARSIKKRLDAQVDSAWSYVFRSLFISSCNPVMSYVFRFLFISSCNPVTCV